MTTATYLWMRPVPTHLADARPADIRQAAARTARTQCAEEHPNLIPGRTRIHLDPPRNGQTIVTVTVDVWAPAPRTSRKPSVPRRRPDPHDQARADSIIAQVAEQYDLTPETIVGHRRSPARVIEARRQVAVRLRQEGWSLPQIGAAVNRDHTTVLDQLRKAGAA